MNHWLINYYNAKATCNNAVVCPPDKTMTQCPNDSMKIMALPAARAIRSYCTGLSHRQVSATIANAADAQRPNYYV
ncbi:MAG: hypothetical protein V4619_00535 [Bacteroidota bacterium]